MEKVLVKGQRTQDEGRPQREEMTTHTRRKNRLTLKYSAILDLLSFVLTLTLNQSSVWLVQF